MKIQHHLRSQFEDLLKNNQWNQYIDLLCNKGIYWWLNLDIIQITNHLNPLKEFPPAIEKPDRLKLLYEIVNPNASPKKILSLYHRFLKQQDYLAAVACIFTGWSNVWNSGTNLMQMDTWMDEILRLKKADIQLSTIEQATVLTAIGIIELMRWGNLKKAESALQQALILAEQSKAFSLKTYIAYGYGHILIWRGDLKKIEVLDFDIAPLCRNADRALIPIVAYQTMKSFYYLLIGEVSQSKAILHKIIEQELFDFFPPSIWLLAYGNLLLANAYDGNVAEVDRISRIIQDRAVPDQNNFHHGYAHFSLGTAALVAGDLYKAELHCLEGIKRSRICNAPIIERICALLMGQVLIDSGEYTKAERHLKKWLNHWRAKNNLLLAGQAALELADLNCKIGKYGAARKHYEMACELLPQFETIPNPHRGSAFTVNLKQKIYQNNILDCVLMSTNNTAINIRAFGNLKIQSGDQIIVDNGRSNLVFAMLKAIVVNGGSLVSINWLMDALWPDLEGDRAYSSFKVTLFRLRRIVSPPKEQPPPWLTLTNKKVSISTSLCVVDSIVFRSKIKTDGAAINDIYEQASVLDLYRADFLNEDDGYPWIIHHRNKLRQIYMDGVMAMADCCLNSDNPEPALSYLKKALEFDNLNEKMHAQLMRTYLKMGLPSQAIETYNNAKNILVHNLNTRPGSLLTDLKQKATRT